MCKSLDLRISNGRCKGDTFGQRTFHGNQGISTVDYVIVSHDVLQHFQNLILHQPSPFSDHRLIICSIKIRATNAFKRNNESRVDLFDLLRQFRWAPDSRSRKIFSPPANHRANKINIRLWKIWPSTSCWYQLGSIKICCNTRNSSKTISSIRLCQAKKEQTAITALVWSGI